MQLPSPVDVQDALALMASRERESWSLLTGHHQLDDCRVRLDRVARGVVLPSALDVDPHADRLPVIAAHGPSFRAAAPTLVAARHHFWVIAPFRSALVLRDFGVTPDVVVLAERDTWPVDDTLTRWGGLSRADADVLRDAILVADAFAPPELVREFSGAFRFDSGLGAAVPLPFSGSGVLAATSLVAALGHRRVSLVGVNLQFPLAEHVGVLATAGMEFVELASDVTPRHDRAPCRQADDRKSLPDAARQFCERELFDLQQKRERISRALGGAAESDESLLDEIRDEWHRDRSVRAAVTRFECAWTSSLWELGRSRQTLDSRLSSRALSALILPELDAAIARHLSDCRACFDQTLGAPSTAEVMR